MIMTFLNTYGPLFILFGALGYFIYHRNYQAIFSLLFTVLATFVIVLFIKELYLVPRPFRLTSGMPKAGLYNFSSFPSSHAALSFCVAIIIYLYKKSIGLFFIFLAILVSWGRVWAQVHTPLDVFMGVIVGLIVGILVKGLTDST